MNEAPTTRIVPFAMALTSGGILFALYQAIRPFHDTIETMASPAWLVSHLLAIAGFVLIATGLLALPRTVHGRLSHTWASRAVVVTWLGTGLTLAYYGTETFGLWLLARHDLAAETTTALTFAELFHSDPVATGVFAIGLALLGVGALVAALACYRSGHASPLSGTPFALGFLLLIPQFFTPQPVRIVHGVLVAVGCVWITVAMLRAATRPNSTSPTTARKADTAGGQ